MENYVSAQLLLFGQSILLGALLGVLYDLLRAFRLRLPRLRRRVWLPTIRYHQLLGGVDDLDVIFYNDYP